MSTTHGTGSQEHDGYDRTRRDFEDMSLEDQATFWVKATASLMARSIQEAGDALVRELDSFFDDGCHSGAARSTSGDDAPDDDASGPGPAEPETGQQRAPRSGPDRA